MNLEQQSEKEKKKPKVGIPMSLPFIGTLNIAHGKKVLLALPLIGQRPVLLSIVVWKVPDTPLCGN